MTISMCACGGPNCPHCNPNIWTDAGKSYPTESLPVQQMKRIAELEAENRRLRGQSDTAKHIQKVAELEAENAKLREKADYSYEDTTRLAELRALAQAVVDADLQWDEATFWHSINALAELLGRVESE